MQQKIPRKLQLFTIAFYICSVPETYLVTTTSRTYLSRGASSINWHLQPIIFSAGHHIAGYKIYLSVIYKFKFFILTIKSRSIWRCRCVATNVLYIIHRLSVVCQNIFVACCGFWMICFCCTSIFSDRTRRRGTSTSIRSAISSFCAAAFAKEALDIDNRGLPEVQN